MTADLVAFLHARLDEDRQAATAACPGPWRYNPRKQWNGPKWFGIEQAAPEEYVAAGPLDSPICIAATGPSDDWQSMVDAAHIARWDPARVLADVQAKRQILDLYAAEYEAARQDIPDPPTFSPYTAGKVVGLGKAVRLLASLYADHPGYRDEWRVDVSADAVREHSG